MTLIGSEDKFLSPFTFNTLINTETCQLILKGKYINPFNGKTLKGEISGIYFF